MKHRRKNEEKNRIISWMNTKPLSTFALMIVVGAYLFYDVYKLYQSLESHAGSPVPVYIFMAFFMVVALVLTGTGLFAIADAQYKEIAGARVKGEEEEEEAEEEREE